MMVDYVDIGGGSPEPEGPGPGPSEGMTRDAESDEVVKRLEHSLKRWEGFGEKGWMPETSQVCVSPEFRIRFPSEVCFWLLGEMLRDRIGD